MWICVKHVDNMAAYVLTWRQSSRQPTITNLMHMWDICIYMYTYIIYLFFDIGAAMFAWILGQRATVATQADRHLNQSSKPASADDQSSSGGGVVASLLNTKGGRLCPHPSSITKGACQGSLPYFKALEVDRRLHNQPRVPMLLQFKAILWDELHFLDCLASHGHLA